MVELRDEAQKISERIGKKLKAYLFTQDVSDEAAEEASQRIEKAVFHSIYTEDQFETALEGHRRMMRELGQAINSELNDALSAWKKYEKRGKHRGYHLKRLAQSHIDRVIELEQRIDAHFRQFEKKLNILSAWRQYKTENDVGSEVDANEVLQFVHNEFDEFEMSETPIEVEEGQETINEVRGHDESIEAEEAEEIILSEQEERSGEAATDTEASTEAPDEDVQQFLEEELGEDI
jgi:Txe/YoeB family toxin of Txe-Axe toxin-antitoxin module